LRHAYCVVGEVVASDVRPESGESDAADDGFVGFASAMAPLIIVVEATTFQSAIRPTIEQEEMEELEDIYPAVNISIKCCSVVPGSSLFLKPEKMPSCFSSALPAALFTSIISVDSMSLRGGMA
jgi:hypothetical protein